MKKRIIRPIIIFFVLSIIILFFVLVKSSQQKIDNSLFICKDCNIILITMTNLRYDHMSSNGYFRPTTPNLDQFAEKSLVFDNAFSHSSWTLPEGISIYTGLYPYEHGIMNRYDGSKLSNTIPTLIDILNINGYKTAAFTGGFDYNPDFGLSNRFSEYQECTKGKLPSYPRQAGPRVVAGPSQYGEFSCTISKALEWLRASTNKKIFLHVQGYDAHCPFSQRGGYMYDKNYKGKIDYTDCLWTFDRSQPVIQNGKTFYPVYSAKTGTSSAVLLGERDIYHLISVYDESIRFADEQIGIFLNAVRKMGISDKTIIVFTSEHGDMFGKKGRFMRGGPLRGTFYDDVLHVPFIIKHPKISPKTLDGLAQHIDLMPTLLDFLRLKSQNNLSGASLVPLILQNKEVNSYIFAGSEFNPDKNNPYFFKKTRINAVRSKQWKLIEETIFDSAMQNPTSQTIELYDIVNDKEESYNLKNEKQDVLRSLQESLNMWLRNTRK